MSAVHIGSELEYSAELYGLAAEFDQPEEIVAAADAAREAGYSQVEGYTPFPVEGLDEAIGFSATRLGWIVLIIGVLGGLGGFFMQYYANVIHYPVIVGGRPLNSWPNFVVITYECTILFSAFTAGLFMLARNGLPRPYHPIFNTPGFDHATRDKFFLCIEATDPRFDPIETRAFLEGLMPAPVRVSEVER